MSRRWLDDAIDSYIGLERRIAELMPPCFGDCCARCGAEGEACCRADVGREAVEIWWYSAVNTTAHGPWWPEDWFECEHCPAMMPGGCCLTAGRPLICSSFFCERMMYATEDPWELVLFGFLSDLPGYATKISNKVNLTLLEGEEQAEPYAGRILGQFEQAHALLDLAAGLADTATDRERKFEITLQLTCHHPRFLRPMLRRRLLELLDELPAATPPLAE